MRLMRMIGLGAIGYGMYKAYKSYQTSRPLDTNTVSMDRGIGGSDLTDFRKSF